MSRLAIYAKQGARIIFGKRAKLPSYIILFVTSKCNSKCRHCFYWKDLNTHKNELTLEDIRKLSSNLGEISNLALSGGEPTLRDDLPDICELFCINNKVSNIHLPTNGLASKIIKERISEILKKIDCNLTVAISLDGLKGTHDSIRGVEGNFDSAIKTYRELAELKHLHKNLKIFVNTVISNKNYDDIAGLAYFIKANMPQIDGYGFDWIRGDPKDKDFGIPHTDKVKALTPFLKRIQRGYLRKRHTLRDRIELGIRNQLSDLKYETLKSRYQVVPCRAGDMFAVIYPQGDVSLCELLPTIGNLREQSIITIWNSKKAEEQRKSIRLKNCWCTHGCFQPTNIMLYPPAYLKILKNIIRG